MAPEYDIREKREDEAFSDWLADHRALLEYEANSEAPHAWVAKRLLENVDFEDAR